MAGKLFTDFRHGHLSIDNAANVVTQIRQLFHKTKKKVHNIVLAGLKLKLGSS